MRTSERLPATPECVAAAREVVCHALRALGCPAEEVDTARLLVSELAANVVRHAASQAMVIAVEPGVDRVRVLVGDDDPTVPVPPGDVSESASSGRGLFLVTRLARQWGIDEHEGDGKAVWFEVAC